MYNAPYSPYTCTTFPMSQHIYKLDVTDFMTLLNRTYSRTKIAYIVTSRNDILILDHINKIPRVSTSDIYPPEYIYSYKTPALFVAYFLAYISLLQKPCLPPIIHKTSSDTPHTSTLQHLIHVTHLLPTQAQTSF